MPPDDAASQGPSFTARLGRALRNVLIFSVVLAAASAGLYARSQLNAKTWSLAVVEGRLVVLKGRLLPFGFEPYEPPDPRFAEAYAPLELEGNTALAVVGQRFGDRDELDRALFSVLELLARPRVASDLPRDTERGVALVRRAEALSGLSEAQLVTLSSLRAEVAYAVARHQLDTSRKQLDEAVLQLKLAADTGSRHQKAATQLLLSVEPQVRALSDALRAAVHNLPPPAPLVAPVTGAPAPATATVTRPEGGAQAADAGAGEAIDAGAATDLDGG
ncbi:MAG: IF-2 protein [Myxococcaceae bacterium]|jgi:hypothetical protein|nr:IF-2 protein [Myxococcaceae bacterium]